MRKEWKFDLKLRGGKVVTWVGETGEDAARRYVDCHTGACVVATRPAQVEFIPWMINIKDSK